MNTYSFLSVQATFVGPPGFNFNMGFGAAIADEGIEIKMKEDKNTLTTGADANYMHSLHASKAGEVTVKTLKTSPLNAKLMAAYAAQTNSPSLHGQNVIVIRQSDAGDAITLQGVAFKKQPDMKYAKEGDVLEWAFDAGMVDGILGTY